MKQLTYSDGDGARDTVAVLLDRFDAVDLDGLNDRAQLLERRDSKYALTTAQLCQFLLYVHDHFAVLEIDGLRQFRYRTVYFDSDALHCYQDHNKGRRQRVKVRYRNYVDHDRHFFEVKLKGRRNTTHKYRVPVANPDYAATKLPASLRDFCDSTIAAHYGQGWPHTLTRSVTVHYCRITLVSRTGAERITIDNRLSFADDAGHVELCDSRWVAEVKSPTGVSETDRWLFSQGIRPVPKCSKYGMAVSLLKLPKKNNRFRPVLKRNFNYA